MTPEQILELKKAEYFEEILVRIIQEIDQKKLKELANNSYYASKKGMLDYQLGLGLWLRNKYLSKENAIGGSIPFYDAIYTDCYSSAIIYLIYRKLNGYPLYSRWILAGCNWIVFHSIPIQLLEGMSLRRRVHFGIKCLDILINESIYNNLCYDFLIKYLIKQIDEEKLGKWHYPYSEITPEVILEDLYDDETFSEINEEEFNNLKSLYQTLDSNVLATISDIFEIATKDLYSNVSDCSQYTLGKLVDIATRVKEKGLPLPVFKISEYASINENNGWGKYVRYGDSFE